MDHHLEPQEEDEEHHHHHRSHRHKVVAKESPTLATQDSIGNKKSSTTTKTSSTKRGGKKNNNGSSSNLETSLNDLLRDPDASSDEEDEDDRQPAFRSVPKHNNTTPTPTFVKAPPSLSGKLQRLGGGRPDFGRDADDNDTFCGLGTVSEMEMKKAPISRNSPKRNQPKGKVALPQYNQRRRTDDDDDDSDEDLFENFGGANPFRMPSYL
jgi:hypothetical protein